MLVIFILLSVLLGVFIAIRNHRPASTHIEAQSSELPMLFVVVIVGLLLYVSYRGSPAFEYEKGLYNARKENYHNPSQSNEASPRKKRESNAMETDHSIKTLSPVKKIVNEKPPIEYYTIQVGAFSSLSNATTSNLLSKYSVHSPKIKEVALSFKIMIGKFNSYDTAKEYQVKHNIKGFIVKCI